jgi:predicted TIM-barrel fold metal-dependent hydrolase
MINDKFVINAVAHANNLSDENLQPNKYGKDVRHIIAAGHIHWQEPGVGLDYEQQYSDCPAEVLARSLFLESDCDMAATHTLRLDSLFKDGLCREAKTVEMLERWPDRFFGYIGLEPLMGLEATLRDFDEQLARLPNATGVKLYPAQVDPHRSWRMDDPKLGYPIFEKAQKHGIKVIAIHKAIPFGTMPMNPFRVDDIDLAADTFPDLAFEIVHAGLAFVEETAMALARFPNMYANLEITAAMINHRPGVFEDAMAQIVAWGGTSKILFGDGMMSFHSQPILQSLSKFQFKQETLDRYGIEQLTEADIALILGKNYARMVGLDIEEARKKIANDEFSRERARTGIQPLFSNWRKHLVETGHKYVADPGQELRKGMLAT